MSRYIPFDMPSQPRILFSAEDTRPDIQQTARALHEHDLLGVCFMPFGLAQDGMIMRAAAAIDTRFGSRLAPELSRRAITEFPANLVRLWPWWEVPRTILSRAKFHQPAVQSLYRRSLTALDHHVARKVNGFTAVYAGNGAAHATFLAARARNLPCIYGVRSFHPESEYELVHEELEKFAELRQIENSGFLDTRRYLAIRRQREWRLADLIIMHSKACRASYSARGLDTDKVFVIPLGFPEPAPKTTEMCVDADRPLKLLWAGTFSVRKGAHYLIDALNLIPQDLVKIQLDVFGWQELPQKLCASARHPITLSPTIPRSKLFLRFLDADALVLPTLADGFAMVITEAMSQGLPVITTTSAGAAEFVQTYQNGMIVPPRDPAALADAIVWCARNRARLWEMGKFARDTAASWQWRDYRRTLARVISETIQPGAHGELSCSVENELLRTVPP